MHCNFLKIFLKRFVDDGAGGWMGTRNDLVIWLNDINNRLEHFDLSITYNIATVFEFNEFLDVKYRFNNGVVETDLFVKPTDAHRYLNYRSHHPKHVFKSVVYSQAL